MPIQIEKYCPLCKSFQYFEWQIEKEDIENNNLDFWLMCCNCGYFTTEDKL